MFKKNFDVYITEEDFEYLQWKSYQSFESTRCESINLSYNFTVFLWSLWIFLIIINLIIFIKILKFKK